MTKKEILEMTGLSEEEFYRQYPTEESWTESYKKGGWIQKATASIKRRGTEGVCTGSKFGGPTCRPGTKRYNLAKTFRKMAKSRKEEGGYVDMYEEGGMVDAYQLMGMPTPEMYEPGGKVRRRYKSPDRTDDNLSVIRSKSTDNLNLPDEYAASYDPNSLNLGIVDAKRYNRALGLDYNKSFGPFTAGIRGGVNKETTPTLYQKKGTRYEKVKEGEAKNILFGGLYGRVGTSIAPDLDTNTEVISFNPSLEVGLDKYGNSTKPYYDASVDVGFLNNMGSIGGGYTNRRQPYAVSLPSEGAGHESYPYAGASLNVPIVRDREGNPRLTVAGGYNIPLSKNTPDSGYAGLTYGFGRGGLIKRKDGSYSRRGLWDNIRANRGSGKKPTKEMLKQERKIRAAEKKEYGGMVNMYGMGGTTNMSHVISAKNFPNMGYAMGGPVMYDLGSQIKSFGKSKFGSTLTDAAKFSLNNLAAPVEQISGNNFVNFNYDNKNWANAAAVSEGILGGATDVAGSVFLGPAYGMGKGQIQGITKNIGNSQEYQRGADKWANKTGQIVGSAGDLASGIMSGNPQQIVAGSGQLLGTAGQEFNSKELGMVGQFAGLGSQFVSPSGSSNSSASTNTSSTMGSNPMAMFGSFMGSGGYAMGGPVNYPEGYQKNITFAMGGEPQEKEMTLKEKYQAYFKAKPVAKYTNFPRHPKVGIDPRGTVTGTVDEQGNPVQINIEGSEANWKLGNGDNFITVANDGGEIGTKKALAFYKNHDNIALAALMHNTAERKAKKEAAEEQAAMTAMDKFVAKYGGAVRRMYAKGGMVPMYDGGSTVLNTSAPSNYWSWGNFQPVLPLENPGVYASLPEFMGTSTIPGSSLGSTPTNPFDISLPLQPMQPRPIDPSSVKPAIPPASPQSIYTGPGSPYYNPGGSRMPAQTFDASNITGFDPGQYPNRVPYRTEAGESWPGTAASKTAGSPGAGGDMSNFGKYAETAAMLGPGLYNLGMGLFSKPEKFDKLKLSGQLKSYETPYQTDYAPYYATKYALRQAGQSSPAALSQLFATFSKQEAANRLANREQNLRRQMAADQFNLSRADQVAQTNLGIDQLNAQQRAARRSMIGEGISNIGQVAAYNKGLRQDKDVLGDLYKNYEFKDGKWVYKG